MKQLGLLILLWAYAAAQEQPTTTEEVLVRCRRPLAECKKFCQFGQHLDSVGCPVCQCLVDPCVENTCPQGKMCLRKEDCQRQFPCTELPFDCVDFPCPQVMCAEECAFGLKKNQYGCDTCTCLNNPCDEKECNADEECKVVDDESCQPGAYCNKVSKCFEKPPPFPIEEPMLPECPMFKCSTLCRFGYAKDERGCPSCSCKTSPCDDVQCGKGEKCTHKEMSECEHDICDLKPTCTVKPICEHQRDEHFDNMRMDMSDRMPHMMSGGPMHGVGGVGHRIARAVKHIMNHPLACDEQGSFKPQQCHRMTGDCWCVNDIGQEIEGTRRPADHPDGKPACPYNRTQAVNGQLQLHHDIGDKLDDHKDNLKGVLTKHLGQWLMIEEEYIQEITITPAGEEQVQIIQVDFIVRGSIEDDIDLASSVNHLRLTVQSEEVVIQYQTFTLKPVPDSVKMEHHFQAEPLVYPTDQGDDEGSVWSFCQEHRTGVIAATAGLIFLLLILIVLAVLVTKRRRVMRMHRMDNFKQNLAFTNEVYGRLAFLDDLSKDKVPEADKNEATA